MRIVKEGASVNRVFLRLNTGWEDAYLKSDTIEIKSDARLLIDGTWYQLIPCENQEVFVMNPSGKNKYNPFPNR